MTSLTFDSFLDDVLHGLIAPSADTFNAMLVTSAYVPNKGTHAKRSDVTNEAAGAGYTAGGTPVTLTIAKDTTNHQNRISVSNPSWANSSITARGLVVYKSRGGAASADNLFCYIDFGSDVTDTNGTFTATINAPYQVNNS